MLQGGVQRTTEQRLSLGAPQSSHHQPYPQGRTRSLIPRLRNLVDRRVTRPLPSGRSTYDTMLDCCKGAYGDQTSGACLAALPSPPNQSPMATGGLDVFYPDYDTGWSSAVCIN